MLADESVALRGFQVGVDHLLHQLLKAGLGSPAEFALGLGWIAEKRFDLGGTEIARIHGDDDVAVLVERLFVDAAPLPGEIKLQKLGAATDELADGVLLASGDDEVLGFFLLQHEPLHFDIVAGVAPVALGVQVAQEELLLEADLDAGQAAGDLAGDEGLTAQRRLVVEEDAVAGVHAVGFAVVDHNPKAVHLRDGVGGTRVEGRGLLLRDLLDKTVKLRGGGLVELGLSFKAEDADGFQQAEHAEGVRIRSVLGLFERDLDVRLRGEIIDLVGLDLLDDVDERRAVGHVAIVQKEVGVRVMRVFVDVVDTGGVEQRRPSLDAMNFVALAEQELSEIGPVLTRDARNQSFLQANTPVG